MKEHLLIVDDETQVRIMLQQALEKIGYYVHEAVDGDEGIRLLKKQLIHLAILDIFMPDKEGIETLLEVRTQFPLVKLIVISGGGSRRNFFPLRAAQSLGAHGTLAKPFSLPELFSLVRKTLAG